MGKVTFSGAVNRAAPAVVSVRAATVPVASDNPLLSDPLVRRFFDEPPATTTTETNLGSGVIVDHAGGYVLTNYHVIERAQQIEIMLNDGSTAAAEIVGIDPETDLAVLHVALPTLSSIAIGDSDAVQIGDVVLAIGNPLGVGQTVTQGIVSATGRDRVGFNTIENFIQTDAAINPGNSGGALIDTSGKLIGINTAILSGQGISFAIPTQIAIDVLRQLVTTGLVERGWLGIDARDISRAQDGDNSATTPLGIIVLRTSPDGPADLAGLMRGDIITHIDNEAVVDAHDGFKKISARRPGQLIKLRVLRADEVIVTTAQIARRPVPRAN